MEIVPLNKPEKLTMKNMTSAIFDYVYDHCPDKCLLLLWIIWKCKIQSCNFDYLHTNSITIAVSFEFALKLMAHFHLVNMIRIVFFMVLKSYLLFSPKNWLIIAELVFIYWLYSKSWASQLSFMKNWEVSVFLVVWTSTKNILYDDYHDFCIENWSLYSSSAIKIAFLSLCLSKFQKLRASFFMV